jgi:hypothetical protein
MIKRLPKIVLAWSGIISGSALFLRKFYPMEVRRKNRGLYWLLFLVSCVALAVAIIGHWPWLTLILPFVTTFFVLAMDII